jgi:hypothetical protein
MEHVDAESAHPFGLFFRGPPNFRIADTVKKITPRSSEPLDYEVQISAY